MNEPNTDLEMAWIEYGDHCIHCQRPRELLKLLGIDRTTLDGLPACAGCKALSDAGWDDRTAKQKNSFMEAVAKNLVERRCSCFRFRPDVTQWNTQYATQYLVNEVFGQPRAGHKWDCPLSSILPELRAITGLTPFVWGIYPMHGTHRIDPTESETCWTVVAHEGASDFTEERRRAYRKLFDLLDCNGPLQGGHTHLVVILTGGEDDDCNGWSRPADLWSDPDEE